MEESKIIEFRKDLEDAIKKVAEKYGYSFSGLGNIAYNTAGMKTRLEIVFDEGKKVEREF